MGRLSIVAWTMMAAVACHHSDDPSLPIDGTTADRPMGCDGGFAVGRLFHCFPPRPACNPLRAPGAQGCAVGEKCTWSLVQVLPERIGSLACVPDGTVAAGEACTAAAVGVPDDCVAGLVCVGGVCRDICGWDGSSAAACETGFHCTRYEGLFENGDDDALAGACHPGCDPVSQLRVDGQPCDTGQGCYLLTSQTDSVAVCATAGTVSHGETIVGTAFANSCVPGAQPRRANAQDQTIECGGLCRPADVTSTMNMEHEGGVGADGCQTRWGAPPPSDGVAGESCRYWWAREPFDQLSAFSNTVGWCFAHARFQYDTNADQVPDAPFPRCTTLTRDDVVPPIGDPPHDDARFFWCAALPDPAFTAAPAAALRGPAVRVDRLRP